MLDGLECCHCGIPVLPPNADGQYWEGASAICPECGCESTVSVDDLQEPATAESSTNDDPIEFGQCQCDGTCGAVARWVAEGHRCRLNCSRIPDDVRQRVRVMIEQGFSEDDIKDHEER